MGEHEIKYAMVVLMGSRAVVLLRRAQVLSCVTLLALVGSRGDVRAGGPAPQPDIRPIKGFERFQEWSRLVWEHVPGEFDPSARMVNSWPPADLFAVKADLWASVTLVNAGLGPGAVVQYTGFNELIRPTQMARPTSRPRSIRVEDVFDLLILTRDRATGRPDDAQIARFMKRAAMLHTDVAMLSPPGALPREPSAAERASTTRRVVDGQDIGWDARPIHWEIARAAIDGVRPAAGVLDPVRLVAAWYRATSAYMAFRREYGYLAPHLSKGYAILPSDGRLQLYAGVLHEAYAMPVVQVALDGLSSRAFRPAVESAADELKLAEKFFRRALDLDRALVTARVHLGRVLGLLGRHDQAAIELRHALSLLTDPRQRYYAELFLGAQEQAAGRMTEAKAAFQRARSHFPNAQAPYLALGQLAWNAADRAGAQVAFERLAALPADPTAREDPWWSYELSAVLDVAVLVEDLRLLVSEDLRR